MPMDNLNNVYKYLHWRGDLLFSQVPLGEVDALIFSELSYIRFDYLFKWFHIKRSSTIGEISNKLEEVELENYVPEGHFYRKKAYKLLKLAGKTPRYREIELSYYTNIFSKEDESQFGVACFKLEDKTFIAFQGTDLSAIGWKEDFQMSYLPQIPSQKMACDFLNKYLKTYPEPIYLGGHSKGGNLAIYGAIFTKSHLKPYIKRIYNFDGPGFSPAIINLKDYEDISNRIVTLIPQDSVIGLLLHRRERPIVVHSYNSVFKQHFGYYWEIVGGQFKRDTLSETATDIEKIMDGFLDSLDLHERQEFVEALFYILGAGDDDIILSTGRHNLYKLKEMIASFKELSLNERETLFEVFGKLYAQIQKYTGIGENRQLKKEVIK